MKYTTIVVQPDTMHAAREFVRLSLSSKNVYMHSEVCLLHVALHAHAAVHVECQ